MKSSHTGSDAKVVVEVNPVCVRVELLESSALGKGHARECSRCLTLRHWLIVSGQSGQSGQSVVD